MTRCFFLLGGMSLVLLGWVGHKFWMPPQSVVPSAALCALADSHVLNEMRLPSVIPSLYLGAKLQFVSAVDLRRAELVLNSHKEELMKPLIDKVLVLPERYT